MLDDKDKLILEYLMHDCRITTTKLAKLVKLSRTAVVYRIQQLEKKEYIFRYDALLNFNKFDMPLEEYFLTVPKIAEENFKKFCENHKGIVSLAKHFNKKNYSILTFTNKKENKKIKSYLKKLKLKYLHYVIKYIETPAYSIFNININFKQPKYTKDELKLDEIDIKILEKLNEGSGKDSILELSRKIGLSSDLVLYRYRKLKKTGYLLLFLAQINLKKFHLNLSFLHLKTKNIPLENILKVIYKINKTIWFAQIDEENYFSTIIFKDYKEYNEILKKLYNELDEDIIEIESYPVEEWEFLNRVDLKKVLKKQPTNTN